MYHSIVITLFCIHARTHARLIVAVAVIITIDPPIGNKTELLKILTLQWWAASRWPLLARYWCLAGPENREKRCAEGKQTSWLLAPSFLWCLTISSLALYHNHTGRSVRLGKSYPACSVRLGKSYPACSVRLGKSYPACSVRLGKSYSACSVHFTLLKQFSSSKDLHFKLMDNKNTQYIPPGLYRAHRL